MDILIHTLSGTATATVIAGLHKCRPAQKAKIMLVGSIGGALPDIDAVSLWSGFDQSIGQWLSLTHSGREIYFGKLWYSHHAFMHSIFCDLLLTIFLMVMGCWTYHRWLKRAPCFWSGMKYLAVYFLTFFLAYLSHLMGDLPTPGGSWDGIALWFPSSSYTGGWGYTWWWNNYDIFLILLTCTFLNIAIILLGDRWDKELKFFPLSTYIFAVGLICFQLSQRPQNFNDHTHTSREQLSLQIQEEILGEDLYRLMRRFDQSLPVYF